MDKQYIIAIIWLSGFLLSMWMLKVEHEAENQQMTNGDQVRAVLLSVLSFGMVLFILVGSWARQVKQYWSKPIKNKKGK